MILISVRHYTANHERVQLTSSRDQSHENKNEFPRKEEAVSDTDDFYTIDGNHERLQLTSTSSQINGNIKVCSSKADKTIIIPIANSTF